MLQEASRILRRRWLCLGFGCTYMRRLLRGWAGRWGTYLRQELRRVKLWHGYWRRRKSYDTEESRSYRDSKKTIDTKYPTLTAQDAVQVGHPPRRDLARSCLALLTCSLPSTGRELSQGILSDFAEKPQVLRLRLAPRTRQTPLRMTTLVGISTEPSCLIYAFSASAKDLRPALIAGLIRGVSGFGLFMRQLGLVDMLSACKGRDL